RHQTPGQQVIGIELRCHRRKIVVNLVSPNRPMGNPKDGDKDNPCHGNPCGTLTKDHEHERPYEVKLLLNGERPEVLGENGIAGEVAYECNALQRIAPHEAVYQRSKEKQNHSLIGPRARPEAEDAAQVETAQGY